MRLIFLSLFVCFSLNSFAGSLIVSVKDEGGYGSEIKYYNLEKRGNERFLYLQDKQNNSCRVPLDQLKEIGLDPLQTGHLLLNSGEAAPVFTCEMTAEEENSTRKSKAISFTSFPKP